MERFAILVIRKIRTGPKDRGSSVAEKRALRVEAFVQWTRKTANVSAFENHPENTRTIFQARQHVKTFARFFAAAQRVTFRPAFSGRLLNRAASLPYCRHSFIYL
jgi:hypothetical protein